MKNCWQLYLAGGCLIRTDVLDILRTRGKKNSCDKHWVTVSRLWVSRTKILLIRSLAY